MWTILSLSSLQISGANSLTGSAQTEQWSSEMEELSIS